jgi:hypothetical protein
MASFKRRKPSLQLEEPLSRVLWPLLSCPAGRGRRLFCSRRASPTDTVSRDHFGKNTKDVAEILRLTDTPIGMRQVQQSKSSSLQR